MNEITQIETEFIPFPKIPRLSRECIVTEKIDGTNALVAITNTGDFLIGSRSRWITPQDDNFGFAKWAYDNKEELLKLGPGRHFGEWWGAGIGRRYGLNEKRFSLFNTSRRHGSEDLPACCSVVPIMAMGNMEDGCVSDALESLRRFGSRAAEGFMNPEGVVIYHTASRQMFKKTLEKDEEYKSKTL